MNGTKNAKWNSSENSTIHNILNTQHPVTHRDNYNPCYLKNEILCGAVFYFKMMIEWRTN